MTAPTSTQAARPIPPLLAVTADRINEDGSRYAIGAHFYMGRHGAITIVHDRDEDAEHFAFAYLPPRPNAWLNLHEARAAFDAWIQGDRQVWTEEQTLAFITRHRAANPVQAA